MPGQGLGLNSSSRSSGILLASRSQSQSSMDQKDSSLVPLEGSLELHPYEERSFELQDLNLLRSTSSSPNLNSINNSSSSGKGRSPPSTPTHQPYSLIIVDAADSVHKPAVQHFHSGGSDDDSVKVRDIQKRGGEVERV